jgi:hypothetical protein
LGIDDDDGCGILAEPTLSITNMKHHHRNIQPWPAPPPPSALAQLRTALAKPFKRLFRGKGGRRR